MLSVADGREALLVSRGCRATIDLAIVDVDGLRLSRTDLCSRLFQERPGIKVLVVPSADVRELHGLEIPPSTEWDGKLLRTTVRTVLAAHSIPVPYVYMFFSRSLHGIAVGDQRSGDDGVEHVTADDAQ